MSKPLKSIKIDILLPDVSQYGVLQHFSRKLYEALTRTGLACRLLEGNEALILPMQSPPDFTLGFNGAIIMEDMTLFCDRIKVPHVACLVDPSYRFLELTSSPYIIFTCDDLFSRNLLIDHGFPRAFFMPHAAEKELADYPEMARIYDIVMPATFIDCEKHRKTWPNRFKPKILMAMEKAIDIALSDQALSFIVAFEHALEGMDIDLHTFQEAFSALELYIKGRDRLDLLNAITDHPVHIFGSSNDDQDWKKYCKNMPNVIVHPAVSYNETLHIIRQSKIVLNSSLKNQYGAHERIFSAAACGSIAVTTDNPFLSEQFTDGKEIILYQHPHLELLNDRISDVLSNETNRLKMAAAAKKKVLAHHTWDHRAKTLLTEILQLTPP